MKGGGKIVLLIQQIGVVLQMKSMGVPDVATFPFATPPPQESITAAVRYCEPFNGLIFFCLLSRRPLVMLGALETDEPHKAKLN